MKRFLSLLALLVVWFAPMMLAAEVVVARTAAELKEALRAPAPGTTIRIGPGEFPGGWMVSGVAGLTVEALDGKAKPVFRGGANAWQFSQCPGLTVRGLVLIGQTGNGLNIDDGGQRERPVRGVNIEGMEVRDVGPRGNSDGIKLSGLDELTVRDCRLEGWGGQGIDMVGCHRVLVTGCELRGKDGFSATAGIQMKGGSSEITVEKCRFVRAGERPVNMGGSTGMDYFRPPGARYEARALTVRECVFEGSLCAAAFVGLDGGEFSANTILYPEKWVFRILQETNVEGFAPCSKVSVRGNRIVFRRAQVATEVNIGPGTAPETFEFARNHWFAEDQPAASKPKLPAAESQGGYGVDPR
jgi:hypothetical protein